MPGRWLRALIFGTLVCIWNPLLGAFIVAVLLLYLIMDEKE